MSGDLDIIDRKYILLKSIMEHGSSKTLESYIEKMGYRDLYNVELSEEGIVSWISEKWKKARHDSLIEANKRAAGLRDYSDHILRNIAQAEKEGPNTTIKLPVGRWSMFFADLSEAISTMNDYQNGNHSYRDSLRDGREKMRDIREGSRAIKEATKGYTHPRDKDAFIKRIQGMSMAELKAFIKRETAQEKSN